MNQDYEYWDAIIVDDGSTDDTANVVGRYSDPRIRYIYQENKGLAGARNTGINQAQGEYLAFLDADDTWEPTFLSVCLNELSSDPEMAAVYCNINVIDESGKLIKSVIHPPIHPNQFYTELLKGGMFPPNAVLMRKAAAIEAGMFDPELRGMGLEDWDLWLRISKAGRVKSLPECLANYRSTPGSMSDNAQRMHECRFSVLEKHFGMPEVELTNKGEEKRLAYGYGWYRSALDNFRQDRPDIGWQFLGKAMENFPQMVEQLDVFYEIICSDKAFINVEQLEEMNILDKELEINSALDSSYSQHRLDSHLENMSFANMYLALAMLCDQAGHWNLARKYLLKSLKFNPHQLVEKPYLRRMLKLVLGERIANSTFSRDNDFPSLRAFS